MELEANASKAEHEAAITEYLIEFDSKLGKILAPYVKFDQLERLSDLDRRQIRTKLAAEVRTALDAEVSES